MFNKAKLRECRKQNGMTLRELSQEIYYDYSTIGKWESGKLLPAKSAVDTLEKHFGVSMQTK